MGSEVWPGCDTNDSSSWPTCTVSLIVHETNAEPAVMKVTLPGLRASYRFPATNNWDYTFILDKDSLVEWFRKAAGMNPSGSKFQEEAGQIYALLKAYELQPPQTVNEFVNLAKADLRDFGFGGFYGSGFNFGRWEGPSFILPLFLMAGATLLFMVITIWATGRLFGEAWVEIEAGRWTPPQKAKAPLMPAPLATPVPSTQGVSGSAIHGEPETLNAQLQHGFASSVRKTSNLLVLACLLGACAGLVPGISYTGSYWGLKLIYFQVPDSPMTVNGMESGSPAEQTGFKLFDEIKAMDGVTNVHPSSHQAGSVVGEKHTYTVVRGRKELVLNAISTTPQLAAIWYEDITCPIAAALFLCIGIVVFATTPIVPPPLWRSISVTIAGLAIAITLGISIGAAHLADRVAIYQRWTWLDIGKEYYFQQGLLAIAAAVLVTILGAVELRQRLTKPPLPAGSVK